MKTPSIEMSAPHGKTQQYTPDFLRDAFKERSKPVADKREHGESSSAPPTHRVPRNDFLRSADHSFPLRSQGAAMNFVVFLRSADHPSPLLFKDAAMNFIERTVKQFKQERSKVFPSGYISPPPPHFSRGLYAILASRHPIKQNVRWCYEITMEKTFIEMSASQGKTPEQPYKRISAHKPGSSSEVAFGFPRDISVPRKNLEDAESVEKRELLRDAQINIWEGHLREGEVADLMRTGKVISSEILDGSGQSEKITLDSGIVGVFKDDEVDRLGSTFERFPDSGQWFNYQLEIAAFQMDRKLRLGMVPLTVERKMNGKKGSFQLWVNDLKSPSSVELPNNARFFDFLIHQEDRGNSERGYHNVGYNPNQVPVLYDHFVTFSPVNDCGLSNKDILKIVPDPHIIEEALKLNMEALEDILCLTLKQKWALLERRDWLIQVVNSVNVRQFLRGARHLDIET